MPRNEDNHTIQCSFCGKTQDTVDRIIVGAGVYICNECVERCNTILYDEDDDMMDADERDAGGAIILEELPKPKELKEILDQYVVGQDAAKRARLSLASCFAVTISIGSFSHVNRICLVNSNPSIFGNIKSTNAKSICCFSITSNATMPSSAW